VVVGDVRNGLSKANFLEEKNFYRFSFFHQDAYSLEKKFLLPRPENGGQGQKMGDFSK
jgi:hypothetical protein